MAESNCDYRGVVDFGDGPVEVRCTKIEGHDGEHETLVKLGQGARQVEVRHNVFDPED